ncbi:hypothetical protein [Streptomyces hiroshimensis]|uniref:Uncharacterized protein n=1 Tax=Streptomyces hiroshimensis TaxID=66424 RepID=A0ABQ2YDJ3_9ACTN|nr:hypothetical protein [Streptomyces hiroshimensis]GGX78875.1 hypothetical protein GCM10010324_25550 [Streptomyces hiroshimensis]
MTGAAAPEGPSGHTPDDLRAAVAAAGSPDEAHAAVAALGPVVADAATQEAEAR